MALRGSRAEDLLARGVVVGGRGAVPVDRRHATQDRLRHLAGADERDPVRLRTPAGERAANRSGRRSGAGIESRR